MFQPPPAALFILTLPYFLNEVSQMEYSSQGHSEVEDYISITKNPCPNRQRCLQADKPIAFVHKM